jgi:hypothetical protein
VICGSIFEKNQSLKIHQMLHCRPIEMEVDGEKVKMERSFAVIVLNVSPVGCDDWRLIVGFGMVMMFCT